MKSRRNEKASGRRLFGDPAGNFEAFLNFTYSYPSILEEHGFQNSITSLLFIENYLYSAWQHFNRVKNRVKC